MRPFTANLLAELIGQPRELIAYETGRRLSVLRPGKHVLETDSCAFDVHGAIRDGAILGELVTTVHAQIARRYLEEEDRIQSLPEVALWEVVHDGHASEVVLVTYPTGDSTESRYYLIADTVKVAEALFERVCRFSAEVDGEVLVFEAGGWRKDERLFEAVRKISLDALVLRGSLRDDIVADVRTFFAGREIYERYRVPYKRGILLYGPPGNGKTHFLKALIASIDAPCLYVKSLVAQYRNDHEAIRRIFTRARKSAPCLLVFEDLETIISNENRSFFLNELDGFAENTGVVVLATTNYPERIDPAIIDRPSRFDRKYLFDLPSVEERATFIAKWSDALEEAMRLSPSGVEELAAGTAGFSFAYLKELTVSSTMAWIGAARAGEMDRVARDVLRALQGQAKKGRAPGHRSGGARVGLVPEA